MYIATIPTRGSKPTILLREGKKLRPALKDAFTITPTLPYGHIATVLGTLCKLGLKKIIARE